MDQGLSWWAEVVFGSWRDRPGPCYQRLASALLDAIDRRDLRQVSVFPRSGHSLLGSGVSREEWWCASSCVAAVAGQVVDARLAGRRDK